MLTTKTKPSETGTRTKKPGTYRGTSLQARTLPIQAKLTVGKPNDKYEKEADQVADRVVSAPKPANVQKKCESCAGEGNELQRKTSSWLQKQTDEKDKEIVPRLQMMKDEEKEVTPKLQMMKDEEKEVTPKLQMMKDEEKEVTPKLQMMKDEEKEVTPKLQMMKDEEKEVTPKLQMKEDGEREITSTSFENRLSSSKGGGSPLPDDTRSFMESGIGADFSNVKVHTGNEAVQMNKELGAQAFTHGNNIYFNQGKYNPDNSTGKHLLAHELTHTVQQGSVRKKSMNPSSSHKNTTLQRSVGNSTIQLNPKKQGNIEQLDEMLNRSDVPEQEVIQLLGSLDKAEKEVVLSGRYKRSLASALNTEEMVQAVTQLNPGLHVKLDWVEEAAGSASSIDYATIKPIITSGSVTDAERDDTKTQPWKEFFVDVCTNETMAEAVTDLGLGLKRKMEWMQEEGTDWTLVKSVIGGQDPSLYSDEKMRDFFVSICDDSEMAEAVDLLGGSLLQKFTWMAEEESNWELVKTKIRKTADPTQKTALYGSDTMKKFFVDVCDDSTMVEAVDLLGGTWAQKDDWLKAEGIDIPANMRYSPTARRYGYDRGDASILYGRKGATSLVPASGFKEEGSSKYIYSKKWSDALGEARLNRLHGDCGLYARELIRISGRTPLSYTTARPGIGLAPASDLTPGYAYYISPQGIGPGAVEEDVLSPWNDKEVVRKRLTSFHVATVVAKDAGTVITSEVNAAFAHERIKPWFSMYSGNAGFFSTFKKEYKKGGTDPGLWKM